MLLLAKKVMKPPTLQVQEERPCVAVHMPPTKDEDIAIIIIKNVEVVHVVADPGTIQRAVVMDQAMVANKVAMMNNNKKVDIDQEAGVVVEEDLPEAAVVAADVDITDQEETEAHVDHHEMVTNQVSQLFFFLASISLYSRLICRLVRGGLGPKSLGGNRFYKGHRDIAEKASHDLKKASIPLIMYLKRLAILEKSSISLKSVQK
jgi:hypothetical protein